VPATADAFEEYRLHGADFSRTALRVVKRMLAGEEVTEASSGLTKREWTELLAKLSD